MKNIVIERLDPTGVVTETIILGKKSQKDYQRFLIKIGDDEYMMTPADGIVKLN